MSLIARDYDNVRLTGFVRGVPQRSAALLNQFIPDRDVSTRTFRIRTVERTNDSAVFRAFDTPAPVVAREGFTEKTGSLPPISEAAIIGEDERLGIYERAVQGVFDDQVEGEIYNDAGRLVRRIRNRMEMARGQVLSTGTFVLAGENGLYLTADFGVPAANLPGGDASTTSAGNWATDASTDIVGETRTLQERSRDENGEDLAYMLCSSAVISGILTNTGIRTLLQSSGITPGLVTESAAQSVFTAHGLPTIVRYDYKVSGTPTIAADRVVFLPSVDAEEFGRTEWGVTAESLELNLAFQDRPGLVGLVMKGEDPVQVKTQVAGLGMPVLHNPNLLYVLDSSV